MARTILTSEEKKQVQDFFKIVKDIDRDSLESIATQNNRGQIPKIYNVDADYFISNNYFFIIKSLVQLNKGK